MLSKMLPGRVARLILLAAVVVATTPPALADVSFQKGYRTRRKSDGHPTHIEPDVRKYTDVLPLTVCQRIIQLGEAAGFAMEHDSIDEQELAENENNRSQAIDVMDEDGAINQPKIYDLLEPYIPKIQRLIKNQRNDVLDRMLFPDEPPDRLPRLGWIFYRKYSPDTLRNSLIPHFDTNMFTVNIALNDDYTGGGIFYVKPTIEVNPEWHPDAEHNFFRGPERDGVPDLEGYQYTYKWVDSLTKGNTTDVVFPQLATGDALIHNYTVWHAVAPLETGTRYSMVLFFDMHNPMLNRDDENDEEEEEEEYDDADADEEDEEPEFEGEFDEEDAEDPEDDPRDDVDEDEEYFDDDPSDDFDEEDPESMEEEDEEGFDDGPSDEFDDEDPENIEDEERRLDKIFVRLRHDIRVCDPVTGELVLIEDNIDVVYVDAEAEEPSDRFHVIETDLKPGQTDALTESYHGHEFRAVRSRKPGDAAAAAAVPLEGRKVLAAVVVDRDVDPQVYEFSSGDGPSAIECEKIAEANARKTTKKEEL